MVGPNNPNSVPSALPRIRVRVRERRDNLQAIGFMSRRPQGTTSAMGGELVGNSRRIAA
jgi:hypothetical protein